MNTENNVNDGATGLTTGAQMAVGATVTRDSAQANQLGDGAGDFRCLEVDCTRSFTTANGLGQHIRHAHKEARNERVIVGNLSKKWWRNEEMRLLAKEDVKAAMRGLTVTEIINYLHSKFERSREAIKKRRHHQTHKDLCAGYKIAFEGLNEQNATADGNDPAIDNGSEAERTEGARQAIMAAIREIVDSFSNPDQRTRRLIIIANDVLNGNSSNGRISGWILRAFPHARMPRGVQQQRPIVLSESGRKRRKQEYWRIQKLFRKDAAAAAREVLKDPNESVVMPQADDVVRFWRSIYERGAAAMPAMADGEAPWAVNDALVGLWHPISDLDIKSCELGNDSAAGPDGVSVTNWSSISTAERRLIYNLIMLEGSLEPQLSKARTVLIPKQTGLLSPGDFRPLSITSVVTRQFHKILARRLKAKHNFSETQRAFTDCDGTVENLSILAAILADARVSRKEVHIACLDVRKAFDSVSHDVIIDTIKKMGCPSEFVNYVKKLYSAAGTVLQFNGLNTEIKIEEGVLQGDPLSPLLFNAVVDMALKAIDSAVGFTLQGKLVSSIAYADDVILVSSTKMGMTKILEEFAMTMATFGLHINFDKSNMMSIVPSGKQKKVKVLTDPTFSINGQHMNQIGILDGWKYLGIQFEGHTMANRRVSLYDDLVKLDKAPLKPQQRMQMLKMNVLPKYLHVLVLGRPTKGQLKTLDNHVRRHVKHWLKLPKDVPTAYLYASVASGGMGVMCLQESVPLIRKDRITKFLKSGSPSAQPMSESYYIKGVLDECNRQLAHIGENVSKEMKKAVWDDKLEAKFDTKHLNKSKESKASTSWVEKRAIAIKAHDYIHYGQIRAGCLPSRTRTSRGRNYDKMCRAGCRVPETNYHVIQQCHRTHGGRVLRHDRIVELITEDLGRIGGIDVVKEPRFRTQMGLRKPDLLITKAGTTWVVDAQVVSGTDMRRDHAVKTRKYSDDPGLKQQIISRCGSSEVKYDAVTISYKGVLGKEANDLLINLGLSEYAMFKIVTSTLRGTWLSWTRFNQMTTVNPLPPR